MKERTIGQKTAIAVIGMVAAFSRSISPRACRFHPSCSVYAAQAFASFGFMKALAVTVRRVMSCHPFSDGGYDPVIRESSAHEG